MTDRFEQYARVAAVLLLSIVCFLIVQPFLGAIIFAGVLCFSTWPLYVKLRARVGGRSWLASLLIVLIWLIALAVPVAMAAQSIVVHSSDAVDMFRGFLDHKASFELPAFIRNIPGVGPWLDDFARGLLQSSSTDLAAYARQYVEPARGFFLALGKAAG